VLSDTKRVKKVTPHNLLKEAGRKIEIAAEAIGSFIDNNEDVYNSYRIRSYIRSDALCSRCK
jgi:hypothetical protein